MDRARTQADDPESLSASLLAFEFKGTNCRVVAPSSGSCSSSFTFGPTEELPMLLSQLQVESPTLSRQLQTSPPLQAGCADGSWKHKNTPIRQSLTWIYFFRLDLISSR